MPAEGSLHLTAQVGSGALAHRPVDSDALPHSLYQLAGDFLQLVVVQYFRGACGVRGVRGAVVGFVGLQGVVEG